jgi:BMFP domain-containing protein YqiC
MPTTNPLLDDVLALGGSFLRATMGARSEMKQQAKQKLEALSERLNMVTRDEFDTAFAMLAKIRNVQEDLNDRLRVIEAKMNLSSGRSTPAKNKNTKKPRLPSVSQGKRRKRSA